MTDFDARSYILESIAHAEEQLMLADSMQSKVVWGNRLDTLEDALYDLNASTDAQAFASTES